MTYEPMMVMMYGLFMLGFLMDVLIAAYMYKDAEKRGKDGIVWGLIGFFFGITALIV